MLLTMVPQWANNPADRIRRWSSKYPLTKFYKAGGISPTTFRRCTSSSFLDREEHAETSGFIFNSWAFFTPPQQVVWGGVFQWLESPRSNVFYGKWPRKLRQFKGAMVPWRFAEATKDGDQLAEVFTRSLFRVVPIQELQKSKPLHVGLSQNGTTEVTIFGLVLWPLPWIKLWYLPLLPLDSALLTKTQTPLRTVNACGCIWELPGAQLVGTIGTVPSCGMFQDLMQPMTKRLVTVESLAGVCSPPESVLHMRCTSHSPTANPIMSLRPFPAAFSQPKIKLVLSTKITKHWGFP